MDEKSPDKLGFKGPMLIFTAPAKTYGRECAFDIATKSDDHVLKLVVKAGRSTRPVAGSAACAARSIAPATICRSRTSRQRRARRCSPDAQDAGAEAPRRHEPAQAPRAKASSEALHLQRGGIEVARAFAHPSRFHHSLSKFVVTSLRGYQIGLTRYEP